MDIHLAAYNLDLDHQAIAMTLATQANILRYILKIIIGNTEKCKLSISFFIFKQ